MNSPSMRALCDGERHLGHVVKAGRMWLAFDGIHSNGNGTGFKPLGSFPTCTAACAAVENAVASSARGRIVHAATVIEIAADYSHRRAQRPSSIH